MEHFDTPIDNDDTTSATVPLRIIQDMIAQVPEISGLKTTNPSLYIYELEMFTYAINDTLERYFIMGIQPETIVHTYDEFRRVLLGNPVAHQLLSEFDDYSTYPDFLTNIVCEMIDEEFSQSYISIGRIIDRLNLLEKINKFDPLTIEYYLGVLFRVQKFDLVESKQCYLLFPQFFDKLKVAKNFIQFIGSFLLGSFHCNGFESGPEPSESYTGPSQPYTKVLKDMLFTHGYYYQFTEINYPLMKQYYLAAIEKGNSSAMNNLGIYYQRIEKNDSLFKQCLLMANDNPEPIVKEKVD